MQLYIGLITGALFTIVMMAGLSSIPIRSFSQEIIGNCDTYPRITAKESNLDILLGLTLTDDSQANFQVSFLDTGTDNVHRHIDYAFIIEDRDGREIFNAVPPGQSTLHTAEGVVTIPYRFQEKGDYTVNVILYRVDFITTIPQVARFPCNDIPEFPLGMMGLFAGIIATTIVISRYFETRRKR